MHVHSMIWFTQSCATLSMQIHDKQAGGSASDPALARLLGFLSADGLPVSMLNGSRDHVKKGGTIAFHRSCNDGGGPDACSVSTSGGERLKWRQIK